MIPRKRKKMLIIIGIITLVLIVVIAWIAIYLTTDMFKSNKTLFTKYFAKNLENINSALNFSDIGNEEYNNLLEQNKYTSNTQVKVSYISGLGTDSENTDNSINRLKLNIDGQVDKNNNYNYQNIKLLNSQNNNDEVSEGEINGNDITQEDSSSSDDSQDNKILELEYINKNGEYGIRFSDLFKQFIITDSASSEEMSGIDITQIEQQVNIDKINDFIDTISLNDEEEEQFKNKYSNIVVGNLTGNKFSKNSDTNITINDKNVQTNSYTLTTTKEELNQIIINLLESLSQEEVVLNRLDNIENLLSGSIESTSVNTNSNEIYAETNSISTNQTEENSNISIEETDLKGQFQTVINQIVENIKGRNIGTDQSEITVYENLKKTVRTTIKTTEYEINLDSLNLSGEEYLQISFSTNKEGSNISTSTNKIAWTINKTQNKVYSSLEITEEEDTKEYAITYETNVSESSKSNNILTMSYEDNENKVEADIEQNTQIVNSFENELEMNSENSIRVNDLDEEQKTNLIKVVSDGINQKITDLTSNEINVEDLREVLKVVGILPEDISIEKTKITETEKNRFNSQFEFYQGTEIESTRIIELLEQLKENFKSMEVISDNELKLNVDINRTNNEDEVETLKQYFEDRNRTNKDYSVQIEYDEETGLISDILIIMED